MAVLTKAEIAMLSTSERLTLIRDLWEGLENPQPDAAVEARHRRVLKKRLAEYDPAHETLLPLKEACDRLRKR